jgi:hypothetical protein
MSGIGVLQRVFSIGLLSISAMLFEVVVVKVVVVAEVNAEPLPFGPINHTVSGTDRLLLLVWQGGAMLSACVDEWHWCLILPF